MPLKAIGATKWKQNLNSEDHPPPPNPPTHTNLRTKLLLFFSQNETRRSDRATRVLKKAEKFPGTRGTKRGKGMKKITIFATNGRKRGGFVRGFRWRRLGRRRWRRRGQVALGGIWVAAGERGVIRPKWRWGNRVLKP